MPKGFEGSENATRKEYWACDPFDIVMDNAFNGRHFGISEEKILEMMASLERYGQIQPIEVRRLPDNRVECVLGFTRLQAIRRLKQRDIDAGRDAKDHWTVNCVLAKNLNEFQAFKRNIEENLQRTDTNPIDHAYQIDRLMDENRFDQTIEQVQEVFRGWSASKIQQIRSLVRLPVQVQKLVASRDLPVSRALQLLKLDSESAMVEAVKPLIDAKKEEERQVEQEPVVPAVPTGEEAPRTNRQTKKSPKVSQAKKTANRAIDSALRGRGVKSKRKASDILRVIKDHEGQVATALRNFLAGEGEDHDLLEVIEAADAAYA